MHTYKCKFREIPLPLLKKHETHSYNLLLDFSKDLPTAPTLRLDFTHSRVRKEIELAVGFPEFPSLQRNLEQFYIAMKLNNQDYLSLMIFLLNGMDQGYLKFILMEWFLTVSIVEIIILMGFVKLNAIYQLAYNQKAGKVSIQLPVNLIHLFTSPLKTDCKH